MPPIYRIIEDSVYSLLNFIPFLLLALYPFRRCLRFSPRVTAVLIASMTVIRLVLGAWAAFLKQKQRTICSMPRFSARQETDR